jgi:hypothetical protein
MTKTQNCPVINKNEVDTEKSEELNPHEPNVLNNLLILKPVEKESSIRLLKREGEQESGHDKIQQSYNKFEIVPAEKLYTEFSENEITAENKYKKKRINISGKIFSIERNIANQPVVNLEAGSLQYVSCRFGKNSEDKLINFKKGQNIKLGGTVQYKMVTTVFLSDCYLLE